MEENKVVVEETKEKKVKKPRWITKVASVTKESLHETKESLKTNKGKVKAIAITAVPVIGGVVAYKWLTRDEEDSLGDMAATGGVTGVLPLDEVTTTD